MAISSSFDSGKDPSLKVYREGIPRSQASVQCTLRVAETTGAGNRPDVFVATPLRTDEAALKQIRKESKPETVPHLASPSSMTKGKTWTGVIADRGQ